MKIKRTNKVLRILDFDIENRPYAYWYDGNTTDFPIAIAWSWVGDDTVHHRGLIWSDMESQQTLAAALDHLIFDFLEAYNEADLVTGHYIRKHDLPILNGTCVRMGLPNMQPKLNQDTKMDFAKVGGMSLSQENLAYMARLDKQKKHMPVAAWEEAYLLTGEGFEEAKDRVVSDVQTHKLLRDEYACYMKPPKIWRP
jgi:hypothetical protein